MACLLSSLSLGLMAQTPQRINYQGVARDISGNPLVSQPIGLLFTFREGGPSGSAVYEETFAITTNALGLFSLHLGAGTPLTGTFSDIDWTPGDIWLEVSMDATGGTSYSLMGSSEMVSVPYALVADSALNGGSKWTDSPYGIYRNSHVTVGSPATYDYIIFYAGDSIASNSAAGWFGKYHPADSATALVVNHAGKGAGLYVNHSGTKGNAFAVQTTGGTNPYSAAWVLNSNPSNAFLVQNTLAASTADAVVIQNAGSADALDILHNHATTGSAANIFSANPTNSTPALAVGNAGTGPVGQFNAGPNSTMPAVSVIQNSLTGLGGQFVMTHANNTGIGVHVQNAGRGAGLRIDNTNPSSNTPGVMVEHNGLFPAAQIVTQGDGGALVLTQNNSISTAPALRVVQKGYNEGGKYEIQNTFNGEAAVYGTTNGTGSAAYFETTSTSSSASTVEASCNGNSSSRAGNFINAGTGTGVYGQKPSTGFSGRAGHFQNFYTSNTSDAVLIQTNTTIGGTYALHANHSGAGKGILISGGGDVGGNFNVSGTLSKGGGSFKIDHPLDPTNKYLYHSFVESPDMMNIYNGIVIADSSGHATVNLPDWFDALNRDFRYQLTCIGGFAPVYVSRKVAANSFEIAGATPGMEISWQLTGIRHDAFANASRIPVEVDKPEQEKGTYLHPEAWGQPLSTGLMQTLQNTHSSPNQ